MAPRPATSTVARVMVARGRSLLQLALLSFPPEPSACFTARRAFSPWKPGFRVGLVALDTDFSLDRRYHAFPDLQSPSSVVQAPTQFPGSPDNPVRFWVRVESSLKFTARRRPDASSVSNLPLEPNGRVPAFESRFSRIISPATIFLVNWDTSFTHSSTHSVRFGCALALPRTLDAGCLASRGRMAIRSCCRDRRLAPSEVRRLHVTHLCANFSRTISTSKVNADRAFHCILVSSKA